MLSAGRRRVETLWSWMTDFRQVFDEENPERPRYSDDLPSRAQPRIKYRLHTGRVAALCAAWAGVALGLILFFASARAWVRFQHARVHPAHWVDVKSPPFDLVHRLRAYLVDHPDETCIGGPTLSEPWRVVAMRDEENDDIKVLLNPNIVKRPADAVMLNWPDLKCSLHYWSRVTVRYVDAVTMIEHTEDKSAGAAACVQYYEEMAGGVDPCLLASRSSS